MEQIMVNEEVMEATEEVVTTKSGKGLKVVLGIGLAVLAGKAISKYIIKPIKAKRKAKKEVVVEATKDDDFPTIFEEEDVAEEVSDK